MSTILLLSLSNTVLAISNDRQNGSIEAKNRDTDNLVKHLRKFGHPSSVELNSRRYLFWYFTAKQLQVNIPANVDFYHWHRFREQKVFAQQCAPAFISYANRYDCWSLLTEKAIEEGNLAIAKAYIDRLTNYGLNPKTLATRYHIDATAPTMFGLNLLRTSPEDLKDVLSQQSLPFEMASDNDRTDFRFQDNPIVSRLTYAKDGTNHILKVEYAHYQQWRSMHKRLSAIIGKAQLEKQRYYWNLDGLEIFSVKPESVTYRINNI